MNAPMGPADAGSSDGQGSRVGGWVPTPRSRRTTNVPAPEPTPPIPPTAPPPPMPPPSPEDQRRPEQRLGEPTASSDDGMAEAEEVENPGILAALSEDFAPVDEADFERALQGARSSVDELRSGRRPQVEEKYAAPELTAVRGEGRSGDDLVSATAGTGGVLEKLELDPKALRADPEALGEQLADAINNAVDDLRAKVGSAGSAGMDADPEAVGQELQEVGDLAVERMGEYVVRMDEGLEQVERLANTD